MGNNLKNIKRNYIKTSPPKVRMTLIGCRSVNYPTRYSKCMKPSSLDTVTARLLCYTECNVPFAMFSKFCIIKYTQYNLESRVKLSNSTTLLKIEPIGIKQFATYVQNSELLTNLKNPFHYPQNPSSILNRGGHTTLDYL